MPKISVIIPAWNAEKTIKSCVTSIIEQNKIANNDIEILVIDDCSADKTSEVVQSLVDAYQIVQALKTKKNSGPSVARNIGLAHATGEWVAMVDGDDTVETDRFYEMIQHAEMHGLDICFDNLSIRASDKPEVISHYLVPDDVASDLNGEWTLKKYVHMNMPYKSKALLGFLKPLIKRDFLNVHGLGYRDELRNSEDFILIVECLLAGARVGYLNKPLYNYFVYKSSLSGSFNSHAHNLLLAVELDLIEKCKIKNDINWQHLMEHYDSLCLAAESNEIFKSVRDKDIRMLSAVFWKYRRNLPIHMTRVARSIYAKLSRQEGRGR